MKKSICFLLLSLLTFSLVAQETRKVFGIVSDGIQPLENVNISVLEKEVFALTNAEGRYEIEVSTGDNLKFSFVGMKTITVKIEDVTRVLNLEMALDVEELEEVVVTKSRRESQGELVENYDTDKRIIRTSRGMMNTDWAIGFVQVIGEKEISPADNCILGLLKNRSAEVSVQGSCNGPMIFGPMGGSIGMVFIKSNSFAAIGPAMYDVDGEIHFSTPIWLDVKDIKRLAILNDVASKIMYGGVAVGGIIVINTVDGLKNSVEYKDRARLRDNYLTEKILLRDEVNSNNPDYLKELENSNSVDESKKIYTFKSDQYKSSPYFILDAYTHFVEKYKDIKYADDIIKNNFKSLENNPVLLKALAYTYESQNRQEKAHEIYKEIFILRPDYAQSFLDMANSYRNVDLYKNAANIYSRYDYLVKKEFIKSDTIGFGKIVKRERNNLLAMHKDEIVSSNMLNQVYVEEEDFNGTRLVFEWNDSEAEFDLQFVNPGSQYYTWKHSLSDNPDTIYREKNYGFSTTEYLLDNALPGIWKININYLGNKSLTPTYLKATIYYNYGSPRQRKEVKVFKLGLKNAYQELYQIDSSGMRVFK